MAGNRTVRCGGPARVSDPCIARSVCNSGLTAESHATQTPADLAGLLALAVCSATIARRVVVEPRPGWREPVNLFVAALLEPGNRKSAVFADAMRPLRELEAELIEAARPTVAREQSDRRQSEARLRKLEKLAAEKGDAEARHEAGNLAAELAEQPEPVLPRLIVDDATSEKLGMMLAEQGGRIASMSPEGGVFDLMAGLYSKSGIPQFGVYLMGHSGDDLITDRVSRKSRSRRAAGFDLRLRDATGGNRGAGRECGLSRPGTCWPDSSTRPRKAGSAGGKSRPRRYPMRSRKRIAKPCGRWPTWTMRSLLRLDGRSIGRAARLGSRNRIHVGRRRPNGNHARLGREAGRRHAAVGGRAALCRAWGGRRTSAERPFAPAVELARYLIPHAEAILNMMQAKEASGDDDARYVLRWIERHGRREFTKRDAQQHGKRRFPKADDIDPALAELTRRGYIRLRPSEATGPGRPPSPSYEVNPAAFADADAEKRSHNSHNPAERPQAGRILRISRALQTI